MLFWPSGRLFDSTIQPFVNGMLQLSNIENTNCIKWVNPWAAWLNFQLSTFIYILSLDP